MLEDALYGLLGLFSVLEEEGDLFEGDGAGVVNVEILKCLLEVGLVEGFGVEAGDQELGVVD